MIAFKRFQKSSLKFSILLALSVLIFGVSKNQEILMSSWVPEKSIYNLKIFTVCYALVSTVLILLFRTHVVKVCIVGMSVFLAGALGFSSFVVPISFLASSFIIGIAICSLCKIDIDLSITPIAVLFGLTTHYFFIYCLNLTPYNSSQVYTVILLLPFFIFRKNLSHVMTTLRQELAALLPFTRYELMLFAIIVFCFLLHIQNVLRPEFDFDALAAHLMVPHFVKAHGQWSFDYNQFVFGVNQLGADFLYTFVYVLSDEAGVRFFNFLIFSLFVLISYQISLKFSSRSIALLMCMIIFSCPLMVTQTSTLHIEGVWSAFLLGLFFLCMSYATTTGSLYNILPLIGFLGGMAMAIKMPSLFYLPFLAFYIITSDIKLKRFSSPTLKGYILALILFLIIGILPYAYCFHLTGNPVFPYFNGVFKSPFFYKGSDFNNPIFNQPLSYRTLYDMTFHGQWFLESLSYPLSLYFLFLLFPIVAFLFFEGAQLKYLTLTLLVFVSGSAIYFFQSYLRYVFPSLIFMLILAAAMMQYLRAYVKKTYAVCVLVILSMVPISVVRFPDAAHAYREFNWERSLQRYAKDDYIYQRPHKILYDYVNTKYKKNSAVLLVGAPLSTGLDGTALVNAWYNPALADVIAQAKSKEDFIHIVKEYGITHIVYDGITSPSVAFQEFIDTFTILELDHYQLSLYKINFKKLPEVSLVHNAKLEAGYVITADLEHTKNFIFEIELSSKSIAASNWSLVFDWKNAEGQSLGVSEHIYNTVDKAPHLFTYLLNAPEKAAKLVISLPNTSTQNVNRIYYGLMKVAEPGKLPSYKGVY